MKALKGMKEEDCRGEKCSAGEENTCENKEEQQDANSIEEQAETDDTIAENANDAFQSQVPQKKTMIMLVCLCMMLANIRKNLSLSRCYKADSEGSSVDPGAKRYSFCPPWMVLSKHTFLSVVFPMTVTFLPGNSESDEIWPMRSQRLREESLNNPRARQELSGKSAISLAEDGFYWDAESETAQCFYCRCRPAFGHVNCQRERCNVTSQMSFRPMLRVDELGMMGVAEHVPGPVLPQESRASRGSSRNDITSATSCSSQTDRLESPRLHMHAESRENHGAIDDSGLYDGLGATASLSGATATVRTSSPSASPSGRSNDQAEAQGDNEGGASMTVAMSSVTEDCESLAQLEVQNRALSQQLRCRVCHQAAIDTILMPCRHLVVCETCTRSMTSCPLCQDTIRAVVRVHVE